MAINTTELIRTSQSWDGANLPDFPKGKPELRVVRLDFPVGDKTGWHHHTVVNYGIVQQGELTIVCQDGSEKTFHEGEPLVEVTYHSSRREPWHQARHPQYVLLLLSRSRDYHPTSGIGARTETRSQQTEIST